MRRSRKQNFQPNKELVDASELAGLRLSHFISWLQQIAPELTQTEATYLASAVLKMLPQVFENNPPVLNQIRQQVALIISQRR